MKRGITINLNNKTFYTLLAIISILVISGIVIATLNPDVPNPGHKISELQKCSNGETLKMVDGNWACGAASGSASCSWISSNSAQVLVTTFVSNGGTGACRWPIDGKTVYGSIYNYADRVVQSYVSCGLSQVLGPESTNFSYYACK